MNTDLSVHSSRKLSPYLWTFGLTFLLIHNLRWSSPECHVDGDFAVWGLPLPAVKFSGATSLDYEVMLVAYLINIAVVSLASFFCMKRALRVAAGVNAKLHRALYIIGFVFALLSAVFWAFSFWVSTLQMVPFLGGSAKTYMSFRPVLGGHGLDCDRSEFWFGPAASLSAVTNDVSHGER
jgi:hypothetical protein